jgi:hypothetical protein
MTSSGGNGWGEVSTKPILSLTGIQLRPSIPVGGSGPEAPSAKCIANPETIVSTAA